MENGPTTAQVTRAFLYGSYDLPKDFASDDRVRERAKGRLPHARRQGAKSKLSRLARPSAVAET